MGRAIPTDMPTEIDQLIYSVAGDMKSFAGSIGLPYTTVYSILCRSDHRVVGTVVAMARALPVRTTANELARILLEPDLNKRLDLIADRLNGINHAEWSRRAGLSTATVSRQINNLNQSQLRAVFAVVNGLGVDLAQFRSVYKKQPA